MMNRQGRSRRRGFGKRVVGNVQSANRHPNKVITGKTPNRYHLPKAARLRGEYRQKETGSLSTVLGSSSVSKKPRIICGATAPVISQLIVPAVASAVTSPPSLFVQDNSLQGVLWILIGLVFVGIILMVGVGGRK